MASGPDNQATPTCNAHVRFYLRRLADEVARIEFSYPAANLGLAEVCRDALALVDSLPIDAETDSSPTEQPNDDHAMELLEAQKDLGLVPRHEYRRKRRELSRAMHQSRFAETPVLRRVVGAGTALLDGLDEGIYALGDFAERLYHQRLTATSHEEA